MSHALDGSRMPSVEPAAPVAHLALVHHANQYVIANGYLDRQGLADILGLRGSATCPTGILTLLQMHLDYRVPINLHLSGTLIEALAWCCPDSFSAIEQLQRAGLLEMVGSAFSQNIMPLFSDEDNQLQINDELTLYRRHLDWDVRAVKAFWVPERVWDTGKLAAILRRRTLLNGGYRYVLLDDRLIYPGGELYPDSERERFDLQQPLDLAAFSPWEIDAGQGLVMLPISRDLRYAIPPLDQGSLERLSDILRWLAASGDERAIAIYGDDLERAAGVGGWDPLHPERYERFLQWLANQPWIRPVLLGAWAAGRAPAGVRPIEQGTFYELAQSWKAGEDYQAWHRDPNCQAHRQHLIRAKHALNEAKSRTADPGILEVGRIHLRHCFYETSWHDAAAAAGEPARLAGWVAALTSHARSSILLARIAELATMRDGAAHAGLADFDEDGDAELVVRNAHLLAVFSPRWGGRLTYLFDLTGKAGRVVVGNLSDDWNLQEELHRFMDHPRNHPGALADVGFEHDGYDAGLPVARGRQVTVSLRNVQPDSPLRGLEKRISLAADDRHLEVTYVRPDGVRRLSTELCFSPDYRRLLSHGRKGLSIMGGPDWRGWRNGSTGAWVRIDKQHLTFWDSPHEPECGHGLNLRLTSFSRRFQLQIGVGPRRGERKGAKSALVHLAACVP